MYKLLTSKSIKAPWNKDKLIGQKPPLKLQEIWAIRIRLQIDKRYRDLALFNLAIDSKLRACDLLKIRVSDIANSGRVSSRAMIMQQKTQRPVQFEITAQTQEAITTWIRLAGLVASDFLFPSRLYRFPHVSRRQYARIVESWVTVYWSRFFYVRHALFAEIKGMSDLSANKESQSSTAFAWACQARKHSSILGY